MSLVFVNGVFDCLHEGHKWFLRAAATYGTQLVVGINSDASVQRLKGPGRPIMPAYARLVAVRDLACVTRVILFDQDTPADLVEQLRPAVLVKSDEYLPGSKHCPERQLVESWGGRVVFLPRAIDISTSAIVAELLAGVSSSR